MPKRLLRPSDFAWLPIEPQPRKPGKKYRATNARILRVRLIALDSRDTFQLLGNANGTFSFTLRWQDYDLARIDTNPRHPLPAASGQPHKFIRGPHIHYFVAGHSLDYARATTEYDFVDPNGALHFFMRYCGVKDIPALQETLRFV